MARVRSHLRKTGRKVIRVRSHTRKNAKKKMIILAQRIPTEACVKRRMVQYKLKPEHMRNVRKGSTSRIETYPALFEDKTPFVITKKTRIKDWPEMNYKVLEVPAGTPLTREALEPFAAAQIVELREPSRYEKEFSVGNLEAWQIQKQAEGTAEDNPKSGMPWRQLKTLPVKKKE